MRFAAWGSAGMVNRCEAEIPISKGDQKPECLLRALGRGATASRPLNGHSLADLVSLDIFPDHICSLLPASAVIRRHSFF